MVPRIQGSAVRGRLSGTAAVLAAVRVHGSERGRRGRAQRAGLVRPRRSKATRPLRGRQRRHRQRQGIRGHGRRPGNCRAVPARRLGRDGDRLHRRPPWRRAGLFAPLPEDHCRSGHVSEVRLDHSPRPTASATPSPRSSATTRSASIATRSTSRTCKRSAPCPIQEPGPDRPLRLLPAGHRHGGARDREEDAALDAEDCRRSRTCSSSGRPMPASSARSPRARPRSRPARPTSSSAAANGSPPCSPPKTRRSTSRSRGGGHPLVAVARDVRRQQKQDLALKFIQYVMSPRARPASPHRRATGGCRRTPRPRSRTSRRPFCASTSSPSSSRAPSFYPAPTRP